MVERKPDLSKLAGTAFLMGTALCWGAVPVLLRDLKDYMDAWTANGFRYSLAAVLYWPVLAIAARTGALNRLTVRRCLVPALLAFGGQVFWALAPYYLEASAIAFLIRLALLWSLVGAMTFFRDERALLSQPIFYLGLLLAVAGFVVLSANQVEAGQGINVAGILIISLCALFFGFYSVSVRYFLQGVHPLVAFGTVSQFVAAGTLVAMAIAGDFRDLLVLPSSKWGVLVTSSILGIALGHSFLYAAVKRLGAAISSGLLTGTPFVTIVLAMLVLGERLTVMEWSAGVAMVAGAVFLLRSQVVLTPFPRGS
jgi:drug/metabolite transporter (DMT)-like permease